MPTIPFVSWEAHLSGAVVGTWACFAELSSASARAKKLALVVGLVVLAVAWLAWGPSPVPAG